MAGVAGSGNPACGHSVQPGSRFCPVCGHPAAGAAAPSQPSTAPLPVVPAWPQSTVPPPVPPAAAPLPQSESEPWDSWYAPRWPPPPQPGPQAWPRRRAVCNCRPPARIRRGGGLGPVPPGDLPTAMLGDLRVAPASGGPPRSGRRMVPVIVAVVLVAIVAGFVIFRGRSVAPPKRHQGTTVSLVAGRAAAGGGTAVRAAAQSVSDRAAVIDAAAGVRGCGPSLRQDARTFARAVSSRRRLLSRLGSLPGGSLLPATMLRDRTGAGRLGLGGRRSPGGGRQHRPRLPAYQRSNASLRASYAPEAQATAGKHRSPVSGTRSPDDTASPATSRTSSKRSVRFRAASRLTMSRESGEHSAARYLVGLRPGRAAGFADGQDRRQ